jgi:hypothetical protein
VTLTFPFAWDPRYRLAALPFGVTPSRAQVLVDEETVAVRFGSWRMATARTNIAGVEVTGPYSFPKTAGPPHLSFSDRGVTFATNGERGVCLQFHQPVRAIDPFGLLRHPGMTVTVADVDSLVRVLRGGDVIAAVPEVDVALP